jgi:hypothetical protein
MMGTSVESGTNERNVAITASRFQLQQPAHMKAILLTFIAPPGNWSPETTRGATRDVRYGPKADIIAWVASSAR